MTELQGRRRHEIGERVQSEGERGERERESEEVTGAKNKKMASSAQTSTQNANESGRRRN